VAVVSGVGLAAVGVALAGCRVPPPAVDGGVLYVAKLLGAVAVLLGVGGWVWYRGTAGELPR
jgi:hypothetical protein